MNPSLARSYHFCETLARRQAGNFYPAFRILPRAQRQSMCALYAFMRIADDYSDEPAPLEVKRANLIRWRHELAGSLRGEYAHPAHEALAHTIDKYGIPVEFLEAVLDGVEMDLEPVRYATWQDLQKYCYRVASAVGLACIHIWGFSRSQAMKHAEQAGLAFQLTNILRDLGEDAARNRVYVPQEDLRRFGYSEDSLKKGVRDQAFHDLMRFQIERARACYGAAWPIMPLLAPPGRAVFLVMAKTYRGLLDAIEARHYDVFSARVRVPSWKRLLFGLQAVPVRLELI